uniref:Reverse transcriptase domain-containing protein n=1 Tax=Ananas comosus var. bracteatus TaxID=296719 RepID=A0A6V7PL94_ANACO|nr:unnamed protein product [Ananas comosus var. bracteatus]
MLGMRPRLDTIPLAASSPNLRKCGRICNSGAGTFSPHPKNRPHPVCSGFTGSIQPRKGERSRPPNAVFVPSLKSHMRSYASLRKLNGSKDRESNGSAHQSSSSINFSLSFDDASVDLSLLHVPFTKDEVFLHELLIARGFNSKWIGWIFALLNSSSSAVLLNGAPGSSFQCRRGLRQGDPLSPLLFDFCVDVLFRLIDKAVLLGNLPAVGLGEVNIHSLHFADDVLLFFNGSVKSAIIIKCILEAFSVNSSLQINFGKSSLSPINLPADQAAALASCFNCSQQAFPLQYLGLPLTPKHLRRVDYLPLIEKIDNRLAGWKCSILSRGGCLILLNSVLSSLPTYFCSAFALPVWVVKEIDRIRKSFFWKGKNSSSGFHCLVNWGRVCHPKKVGGVGIRSIQATNSALLMRGLWKFYTSNNLPWTQLLKLKHYKRRPAAATTAVPYACSPIWRYMLSQSVPFLSSVDFALGDGKATPFWNARWCGDVTLRNRFSSLYAASANTNITVHTWFLRYANQPNLGFQPMNDPQVLQELQQLTALSTSINLSSGELDEFSWRWTSTGRFSVSSAAEYASSVWTGLLRRITFTQPCRQPMPNGIATRWCRLRRLVTGQNLINLDLAIATALWEIWKERNRRLFDNWQVRGDVLGTCILETALCWKSGFSSTGTKFQLILALSSGRPKPGSERPKLAKLQFCLCECVKSISASISCRNDSDSVRHSPNVSTSH